MRRAIALSCSADMRFSLSGSRLDVMPRRGARLSATGGAFAGGSARLLDIRRADDDPRLRREVDGVQVDAGIGDLPGEFPERARFVLDLQHQGVLLAGHSSAGALQRLTRLPAVLDQHVAEAVAAYDDS